MVVFAVLARNCATVMLAVGHAGCVQQLFLITGKSKGITERDEFRKLEKSDTTFYR